jgi:hypothetical protein
VFQRIIKLEYEFPNGFSECPKALVESLLVSLRLNTVMSSVDLESRPQNEFTGQ